MNFGALAALLIFIAASVWLGTLAHRVVRRSSFVKGYFLGNRGLGAWAVALTATVQSGGTFMGFPSLVYSHGWIVLLWIGSYMAVPITGFMVLGKRLAHLSRQTGAITVPDLFRERFRSPGLGLIASLLIIFFMTAMMVAQFKAGANVMKIAWPGTDVLALSEENTGALDEAYYIGLAVFAATVVGYTLIGGFLAAVWTDLFQSVMMLLGVIVLLALILHQAGNPADATMTAMQNTGPSFAFGPGYSPNPEWQFLPFGLAFSFFCIWPFTGLASPSGVVRVMACKNTATLRRSIFLLSWYNLFIYVPLVIICVCGRSLIPTLPEGKSDEIIPRLAMLTTRGFWGGSFVAGLILAAPFGAIMATVSSYLVVIASGLVRDIYQRFFNPQASDQTIRRLSYATMIAVGLVAVALNIQPVAYLQAVVIFSGTTSAATLLVPLFMACYWRRATAAGTAAAMLVGAVVNIGCYVLGWSGFQQPIGEVTGIRPYFPLEVHPIVFAVGLSFLAGVLISLFTRPPPEEHVSRLFDAN